MTKEEITKELVERYKTLISARFWHDAALKSLDDATTSYKEYLQSMDEAQANFDEFVKEHLK
jgi:hypothetical protein